MLDPTQAVQLWQVDLRQPAGWIDDVADSILEPDERERAARGTPEVRRRRVVARAALRIALSRCVCRPPDSLRFVPGPLGKPELAEADPGGGLHFNLSRSGDCCLIAVTRIGPIGIDVERLAPLPKLEEIVASRFAPAEAAAILALRGDRRLRAFYNCWTRKEAYLKARGLGLTALDRVVVTVDDERPAIVSVADDDRDDWTLASVDPGPGLVGAVALRGAGDWAGDTLDTSVLPLGSER